MKKPPLVESLGIRLRGIDPLDRLAGLIVVNLELTHVKVSLSYAGVGAGNAYRDEGRPRWANVVVAQTGWTKGTEQSLTKCAAAVKARLAASEESEARDIMALMETPPSKLSDAERQQLVDGIRRHGLKDGDTQVILKREAAANTEPEAPRLSTTESGQQAAREIAGALKDDSPQRDDSVTDWKDINMTALGMSLGLGEKRAMEVVEVLRHRQLAGLALKALKYRNGGGL